MRNDIEHLREQQARMRDAYISAQRERDRARRAAGWGWAALLVSGGLAVAGHSTPLFLIAMILLSTAGFYWVTLIVSGWGKAVALSKAEEHHNGARQALIDAGGRRLLGIEVSQQS